MLADLPTTCDVGCKKNSKGYKETWTGYKLHIDVACGQIPVSCLLTSASVHDSQVAIPLMTMTSARVSYLYDLMDAAYDAAAIHDQSRALGHAPIVDRNFRADHQAKAECGREVERLKLIHMPDFHDRAAAAVVPGGGAAAMIASEDPSQWARQFGLAMCRSSSMKRRRLGRTRFCSMALTAASPYRYRTRSCGEARSRPTGSGRATSHTM